MLTSVGEPEPRAEEQKLNCLLEPEPKLRIAAPAPAQSQAPVPFYFSKTWRNFIQKIMVAAEVFVICYNFNPIRIKHASIYLYSSKKSYFQDIWKNYTEQGPEPEPQFRFAAPRSRSQSRKKYFGIHNTVGNIVFYVKGTQEWDFFGWDLEVCTFSLLVLPIY